MNHLRFTDRPGYFITAPNVFHIGVEETVSVSVYNVSQRLKIKLYLQDYPNRQKILFSAESTFANGKVTINCRLLKAKVKRKISCYLPQRAWGERGGSN